MKLRRALPALLLSLAPLAACGGATVDELPAAGAGGVGGTGTGTGGTGTGGTGTGGSGVAGSAGTGVAGSAGSGVAGKGGSGVAGKGGSGVAGKGGSPGQCTSDVQCPVGPCTQCPDGSKACPVAKCTGGKCTTSQPTCSVGPQCKTAADCPQPGGACQQCPDGTFSCPSVDCVGGVCTFDAGGGCKPASCDPQDAFGDGACFGYLGVKWNGASCENVTGCACVGADCGALYKTQEQCVQAHAPCVAPPPCAGKQCGDSCSNCPPGAPCPPVVEYCGANGQCSPAFPVCEAQKACLGASCGTPCVEACDFPGCPPAKGTCNGAGQCSPGGAPVCKAPECAAMKAQGQGMCDAFFGFAWNGAQCVGLGGCSCVGPDCNKLYQTMEHCLDERAACACLGKTCGAPCNCPGGDCKKMPYTCTSDFNGSCQPGQYACPF